MARQRRVAKQTDGESLSTPVFVLVIVIGALFTVAILYVIGTFDGA